MLALKILFGTEAGKDTTHFRDERNALLTKVNAREIGLCHALEHLLELSAVNAALWHAEDDLREHRGAGQQAHTTNDIVELAFRIQELNDQRAGCIQTINEKVGDKVGTEKLT